MNSKPLTLAWLSVLLVISLGSLGWSLFPEDSSRWAFVVFFLPALWAFVEAMQSGDSGRDKEAIMNWHRSVFAWVGLVIAVGVGFELVIAADLLGAEWEPTSRRIRGLMFGIGLAIWGNYLPKVLSPWAVETEPFDWQRVHRFAGWVASLCGVAVVLSWMVLPLQMARLASVGISVTFGVLTVGRKFMSVAAYSRRQSPPRHGMPTGK